METIVGGGPAVTDEMRRRAITSYGIIPCLFDAGEMQTVDDDRYGYGARGMWRFLIAQRRDTIAYSEFIKARIPPSDLVRYSALMTRAERERISQFTFPQLWHDFWIHVDNRLFHSEYARCAGAFGSNAEAVARSTVEALPESPWGFPKGRKCPGETDMDCALREFEEETRIDRRALHPVTGAPIIHEYYMGSDQKMYRTIYYLCLLTYFPSVPILLTPQNIRKMTITEEIGSLRWADIGEAFRRMDASRRRVVRAAHQFLLIHGQRMTRQVHLAASSSARPAPCARRVAAAAAAVPDNASPGICRWFSTNLGHPVPYAPAG